MPDPATLVATYRSQAVRNNPDCPAPGPPARDWIGIIDRTKDGLLIGIGYYCPEHWRAERPCWAYSALEAFLSAGASRNAAADAGV